jgi:hypothetical protein
VSEPIDQRRLLKRARAAQKVLERAEVGDPVDPVLLLSFVVWPSLAGDKRERELARELRAKRAAVEHAAYQPGEDARSLARASLFAPAPRDDRRALLTRYNLPSTRGNPVPSDEGRS